MLVLSQGLSYDNESIDMDKHFEPFRQYVKGNLNEWNQAFLKVYFKWSGGMFTVEDSFIDSKGNSNRLQIPMSFRRKNLDSLQNSLLEFKRMTEAANLPKWNVFKYDIRKDGGETYSLYWDQAEEDLRNPVIENDKESYKESLIHDRMETRFQILARDPKSTDNLRPYYSIVVKDFSIAELVKEMMEKGGELEIDYYDELDFTNPIWDELLAIIKNNSGRNQRFMIQMDGAWSEQLGKYTSIDFKYIVNGKLCSFSIPI